MATTQRLFLLCLRRGSVSGDLDGREGRLHIFGSQEKFFGGVALWVLPELERLEGANGDGLLPGFGAGCRVAVTVGAIGDIRTVRRYGGGRARRLGIWRRLLRPVITLQHHLMHASGHLGGGEALSLEGKKPLP